ncbi:MAG: DUF5998 family protein [Actinomycetales bacterium]
MSDSRPSAETSESGAHRPPQEDSPLAGLREDVLRAGYYPDVVMDTVADVLGDEAVRAHLVHQETTFDRDEVRRHMTVLVLTSTRLVVTHTDDHPAGADSPTPFASASAEVVPLSAVRSVVLHRIVPDPTTYVAGSDPHEVVLTLGWAALSRIDLEPAGCSDPTCEADHGYTGTLGQDDLSLRVSAAAEGPQVVAAALAFGRAVSRALVGASGRPV